MVVAHVLCLLRSVDVQRDRAQCTVSQANGHRGQLAQKVVEVEPPVEQEVSSCELNMAATRVQHFTKSKDAMTTHVPCHALLVHGVAGQAVQ